jgi:hypothetical protein
MPRQKNRIFICKAMQRRSHCSGVNAAERKFALSADFHWKKTRFQVSCAGFPAWRSAGSAEANFKPELPYQTAYLCSQVPLLLLESLLRNRPCVFIFLL